MVQHKPIVNSIGQIQEQIDNANYAVTIIWGTCEDKTETYAFDTEEDREMFLLGDRCTVPLEFQLSILNTCLTSKTLSPMQRSLL